MRHFIPTIDANQRDWLLWGTLSILIAYGMVMFFSTSLYLSEHPNGPGGLRTGNPYALSLKQFSLLWLGMLTFFITAYIPAKIWNNYRLWLGVVALILLIVVLIIGDPINGSKRWLSLGIFHVQVTEIIKLIYIIYLAGYIKKHQHNIKYKPFSVFFVFILPTGIVCTLLIFQPDLGTTVEILFFTLALTFMAGTHLLGLLLLFLVTVVIIYIAIQISPHSLERIISFTNPWNDPYGSDYNIGQALRAIGHGDWMGVGLGNGIHKLGYMREIQNDFIISVLIEELGYIGFLALIILFAIVLYRLYKLGDKALQKKHIFSSMMVFGVMLWLFFQLLLNAGGTINLLPIKGLVLPFFSSGGTFTLVFSIALGVVFRIEKEVRLEPKTTRIFD